MRHGLSLQEPSALQPQTPSHRQTHRHCPLRTPVPVCTHAHACRLSSNRSKARLNHVACDHALTLTVTCTVPRYVSFLSGRYLASVSPTLASTCPRARSAPASPATAGIRNHVWKGLLAWYFRASPTSESGQDAGRVLCQRFCPVALGSAGGQAGTPAQ